MSAVKAAFDFLCTRLQRDPAQSEVSDTVSMGSAARAMVAYSAELVEQIDVLTTALAEATVIIAKHSPEGVEGLRKWLDTSPATPLPRVENVR